SLYQNKKRLAVTLAILAAVGYFTYRHYGSASAQTRYVLAQASRQTIVSTVSGTGQVAQDHTVNITPPTSGKLTSVNVTQGQKVSEGQTIAVLDETNNSISLNQAKASLASAQANYQQALAGSTSQDIDLAKLTVQADQQALDNANSNYASVKKQQDLAVASALSNLLNSTFQATPSVSNLGTATVSVSGNYTGTTQGSYTLV